MSLNDMLFLSKDDYHELGLCMIQRNRLINFCKAYQNFAKDYSIDEIKLFFNKNKHYLIKKIDINNDDNTSRDNNYQRNNNNTQNNHNNSNVSSRNENLTRDQDKIKVIYSDVKDDRYNNEVFMTKNVVVKAKDIEKENQNNSFHNDVQNHQDKEEQLNNFNNNVNGSLKYINKSDHSSPIKKNQIQHIELQFSSSMSSMSNGYKSPQFKRYKTPSTVLTSYNKINKEIESYMINHIRKKSFNDQSNFTNNNTNIDEYISNKTNSSISKKKSGRFYPQNSQRCNTKPNRKSYPNSNSHNNNVIDPDIHTLNRNDSLTNLHDKLNPKIMSSVDILTECIKKKDDLILSLNHCNNKINESKKVIIIILKFYSY